MLFSITNVKVLIDMSYNGVNIPGGSVWIYQATIPASTFFSCQSSSIPLIITTTGQPKNTAITATWTGGGNIKCKFI